MKLRDKKELHTKTQEELKKVLKEAREASSALRLEQAQGKLKNTGLLSQKRNEIAVVQTIMNAKKEVKNG